MIYIAQKSCIFSRRIELPATQENTVNPGESPANFPQIPGKFPMNSRRIKFATTQAKPASTD